MPVTIPVALHRRAVLRGAATGVAALAVEVGPSPAQTPTRQITVERLSIISAKPFAAVIAAFEASVGRPDIDDFQKELGSAQTFEDLQKVVERALGKSGFIEFARFNLGFVVQKERSGSGQSMRFLVGNPLIMKEMVKYVPDAGSYAPVTVLIDERADGVHLSYDKMASFLAPYGNAAALAVARDLDAKVEALLRAVAA
jgi:uncharacterized protein (DUF302 family)